MSEPHSDPQADQPQPEPPVQAKLPDLGGPADAAPAPSWPVVSQPPAKSIDTEQRAALPDGEFLPWQEPTHRPAAAAPVREAPAPPPPADDVEFLPPRRRTSAVLPPPPILAAEPAWRDKLRGQAALAGLVLLALAIAIPWWQRHRTEGALPDAATLLQAADLLGKRAMPGDAVGFAPGWSAHQRILFQQRWLDKGWDPKADFLTAHPLDLWQADGRQRLWVVSTHGWASKVHAATQAHGAKRLEQHQLGHGTAVELYSLPTSTTVLDVRRSLSDATAQTGGPEEWKACTWQPASRRFACGGANWQDVFEDLQEVGSTRRDCIYLHPPQDHGAVRVTVREATAARVVGRVGNRLWAVRHGPEGAPVRFRVLIGGQVKFERTLATDDFAWHPFEVAVPAESRGQPVTFEAYSDKEAWRELCFDARLQTAPGQSGAAPNLEPKVTP